MIQIAKSLEQISTGYSIFEKDQVLTHDQLNSIVAYCTDEARLTRVKLLGVGILCGLRVSLAGNLATVTRGAGITTDGDLAFLDGDAVFDKFKLYDKSAPAYSFFYDGENMITVYELVRRGQADDRATALSQFTANTGSSFNNMAAALFVESYVHDEDICTITDCDNLGKNSVNQVRVLLLDKASVGPLKSAPATADQAAGALNEIAADRPLIGPNITTAGQLALPYRSACNSIHAKLAAELPKLYPNCSFFLSDLFPANPSGGWLAKLQSYNAAFAAGHSGIQYYYDFLKDAVETWNSFRELLFGDRTWCCPDIASFPKHLLLGNLVPGSNPEENRTAFYPSPLASPTLERLNHAKFLAQKLDALIQTFQIPSATAIRITPSRFEEDPLEERAIPYYYQVGSAHPIHRSWSFRLSRQGMAAANYSYNAAAYGALGAAANPLNSRVGGFSFFRIEGQLGQNVSTALAAIESEIKSKNLPIAVRTVLLGEDRTKVVKRPGIRYTDLHRFHYVIRKDLDYQLEEVMQFSGSFRNEVGKLTADQVEDAAGKKNIAEQKDSTIAIRGQTARSGLNRGYSQYKADPAWKNAVGDTTKAAGEFKYNLGDVTKTEFTTPFDALIASTHPYWLDWLDVIIQDKEDKEDEKLLFSKFQADHPGLEHFAGALRGGTFVLVYDADNKVTADFMLPYFLSDTAEEETPEPPLPKPPIKIPWIVDHGVKVGPSLDKYVTGKLGRFQVDLDTKWQSRFDVQQDSFKNSFNLLGNVLGGRTGQTPGNVPGEKFTDPRLRFQLRQTQTTTELINDLNAKANDPSLRPEARENFVKQAREAESELAKSIQEAAAYIDRSGTSVAAGSEGQKAMQELANGAAALKDPAAVERVKAGLTDMQTRTGNAGLRTEIGNLLGRIR